MKKVTLCFAAVLVAFCALTVFDVSVKIYGALLKDLFAQKSEIYVYSDDEKVKRVIDRLSFARDVETPRRADLLILSKEINVQKWAGRKPVLVTRYYLLRKYPDVLGGFFWQKGRPNIILLRSSLKRFHIAPPPSLREFVESKP